MEIVRREVNYSVRVPVAVVGLPHEPFASYSFHGSRRKPSCDGYDVMARRKKTRGHPAIAPRALRAKELPPDPGVAATPVNAVIDLSHHNGTPDLGMAKADGILGVIQKATQGRTFVDPTYARNRQASTDAGLHWGAYHFGTGGDGVRQAAHFVDTVSPRPTDLLVLDFEANHQGPSMSLEEARAFVTHVRETTGRWPGIYSGHYVKELLGTQIDAILGNCWFWLAQYGPTPVVPPTWKSWTVWQYTDGAVGPAPHEVQGVGRCDRDKFNGSADQLGAFWKGNGAVACPAPRP